MAYLDSSVADQTLPNPLDLVEQAMTDNGWPYERLGEEEITASVTGKWCEYHLRFFWREEGHILQTACMFDTRVPEAKKPQIYETIGLLNERMWLGHFELWSEEGMLLFRHAAIMEDAQSVPGFEACETLIETALVECERFYPVFQFVIWAGKTPQEAIEGAMLETMGEA